MAAKQSDMIRPRLAIYREAGMVTIRIGSLTGRRVTLCLNRGWPCLNDEPKPQTVEDDWLRDVGGIG